MKKVLAIMAVFAMALVMVGCSSQKSPRAVADKAMKCMQKGDYKGYVDLMYIPEKEGKDVAETRQGYVEILEAKVANDESGERKVTSFEFVSEEINEESNAAVVTYNVTYGNGSTKEDRVKLKKDENGKWWLDSGK